MASGALTEFLHRLRRRGDLRGAGEVLDTELLERFVTDHDEAAFTAVVQRHGPMVWRVCRQLLVQLHDAEDAFQATFLVLVRKAAAIQRRGQLAGWLYGVAYRTAVRARRNSARRCAQERQEQLAMPAAQPSREAIDPDLSRILHEELNRLPEKYRTPMLLCYLQGRTNQEAASQLAWPVGTVKGRLVRARAMLRKRLTRRGLGLSGGNFAVLLSQGAAPAAVPTALLDSTIKAAISIAAGQAATAGEVSVHVAALIKGVLQTMFLTKLTITASVLLTVTVVGSGAALLLHPGPERFPEPSGRVSRPEASALAKEEARKDDQEPNEEKARETSRDNLKSILLAMHNYHDANGHLFAYAVHDNNGKALLSWRVLLLPYLEQTDLFKEFKLDESWDSEHNKKLLSKMPKIYAPPRGKHEKNATVYQVFTGKDTPFEGTREPRIPASFPDGTSNTILVVEAREAVPWTKPADVAYDPDKEFPKVGGMFTDVFHAAFCDGAVHRLKLKFDEAAMRAFINPRTGLVKDITKIEADR